ncbi:MAG: phytanoyl-CoA dioxygenase family protein [Pseudomonadota bacterium]
MDISEYGTSPNVDPLVKELDEYGLMKHVVELEAYGMTVVPPETMGVDEGFVTRLRNAILNACAKRNNIEIGDYETAAPDIEEVNDGWLLLGEDEVFVEASTNPRMLALVRWLCGQSAFLSGHTWIIKPKGGQNLGLHSDAHGIPPGGGHIAHACNASWLCTDYEGPEDGPTVFVPGSHRYGRATLPHETEIDTTPFQTVPLIGKAGSLAIWHGATWHASVPRTKDGLRVTLVQVFMRRHMQRICMWEDELAPEMFEKYPELAKVLGNDHMYPFKYGAAPERIEPMMVTGTDPFA